MKKSLGLDAGQSRANHSQEGDALFRNAQLSSPTETIPSPALSKISISVANSHVAEERRRARISRFAELRAEAKMAQTIQRKTLKPQRKIKSPGGGFKLEGLSMVDRLVNFIARGIKLLEIMLLTAIGRRKDFKPIAKSEKIEKSPATDQKKIQKREIHGQSAKLS